MLIVLTLNTWNLATPSCSYLHILTLTSLPQTHVSLIQWDQYSRPIKFLETDLTTCTIGTKDVGLFIKEIT